MDLELIFFFLKKKKNSKKRLNDINIPEKNWHLVNKKHKKRV